MISFKYVDLKRDKAQPKGKAKYIIGKKNYFAEEFAIAHYKSVGYNALWSENYYWWTLMSLVFWDIIFAKIQGAVTTHINGIEVPLSPNHPEFEKMFEFMVKMNGMPSGFFHPEFYRTRKDLINNSINALMNSDLKQEISKSYKANYGKNCRPIEDWDRYSLDELLIPIGKISNHSFLRIMERFISNFNYNRAGLPDLIVYNGKEFFFSEVKSENDRISDKQMEWHSFLSDNLKINVDIFLINHSKNKIKRLVSSYLPNKKVVKITFGFSTSKNRKDAIEFVKSRKSYFTEGEGKEQIYGAEFDTEHIEDLYKILDLTSKWKTQRIEIDGIPIKSTDLRNSLWCFRKKTKMEESLDYCRKHEYNNLPNKFGCRNIYFQEMENDSWQASDDNYGYFDKNSGEWIFNTEIINKHIEEQFQRLQYCPLFNLKKIKKSFNKLPTTINPKEDNKWALISSNYNKWFWYENKWINTYGDTNFPGFDSIIGVERSIRERSLAVRNFKMNSRR